MNRAQTLHSWHQTRVGLFVWALLELLISYGMASLAIDRGTLWWYLLTLIFLIGGLRNLFKLIGTFVHGRH